MFTTRTAMAFAALGVMSAAHAGIMTSSVDPTASLNGVLDLGADGVWNSGDDYWHGGNVLNLSELWIGRFGDEVEFDVSVTFDDQTPRTPTTDIVFNKMVTNNTNFFWSAFQIVITPGMGSTIMDVFANPNDQFEDVSVNMGGNGSFIILWEQGMSGAGVGIGETATFDFGFNIDGNLGFMIKQTPIPAPSAAALLGAAGLFGARRRRN